MDNTQILIAALKQDKLMKTLHSGLHGFQTRTIEPAFEGELIRALDSGLYHPAVLIISKSICDTSIDAMVRRIRRVSDAVLILAVDPGFRVAEEVREGVFSVLELPQEGSRIELVIKSAVQAYLAERVEESIPVGEEKPSV